MNINSNNGMGCKAISADIVSTMVLLSLHIVNEAKTNLKTLLDSSNITLNQWFILKMLYLDIARTPTSISIILNRDTAAITRNLDILEEHALIERQNNNSEDRRSINIKLTENGLMLSEQIFSTYPELLSKLDKKLEKDELQVWSIMKNCIYTNNNSSKT